MVAMVRQWVLAFAAKLYGTVSSRTTSNQRTLSTVNAERHLFAGPLALQSREKLQPIPADIGREAGSPWTGYLSITGLTDSHLWII